MQASHLLSTERAHTGITGVSRKRVLQQAAKKLCQHGLETDEFTIFDALIERERLGSTGIGSGIAIPHCRLEACTKPIGLLLQLNEGIDFDSIDKTLVDLVFVLIVPKDACDEHLEILSHLAHLFNLPSFQQDLRKASNPENILNAVLQAEAILKQAS